MLALIAWTGGAHAAPNDPAARAQAAADAGSALFERNDYAGAAVKFKEAYALTKDPSYLFNLAQVYRHAGDCVSAADYYGRFLGEVPNPPNVEKIRGWYASQMACAKAKTSPKPDGPTPDSPKPDSPKPDGPKPDGPKP